jgi:hypothetical protein
MNFTGTNVTITVITPDDLTSADNVVLTCKKPDYTVVELTPDISGSVASYVTAVEDVDVPGLYLWQLEYELGGQLLKSDIVSVRFYKDI